MVYHTCNALVFSNQILYKKWCSSIYNLAGWPEKTEGKKTQPGYNYQTSLSCIETLNSKDPKVNIEIEIKISESYKLGLSPEIEWLPHAQRVICTLKYLVVY